MKRLAAAVLLIWGVVLAGCNTMEGLGKDVERAGEAIQRKAK